MNKVGISEQKYFLYNILSLEVYREYGKVKFFNTYAEAELFLETIWKDCYGKLFDEKITEIGVVK